MRFKLLLIIGLLSVSKIYGQTESDITGNIIYGGFGRQGAFYLKYERLAMYRNRTQTIVNLGVGRMQGDSDPRFYNPGRNIITLEVGQLFRYKMFFLEIGIEPAINFYGKNTYIDVNGVIGLRYQSWIEQGRESVFAQLGYNPRLYYSYKNDVDFPVYIGLGVTF